MSNTLLKKDSVLQICGEILMRSAWVLWDQFLDKVHELFTDKLVDKEIILLAELTD